MDSWRTGGALRPWRTNWPAPAAADAPRLIIGVFVVWLVAFLLKHAGAAWDVAWHFRYPFGIFESPHLVNIVGSGIATALVVFHTLTGRVVNRFGLYLIQGGLALFLLAVLLDMLNHYLFGLDVTVWSPSHLLVFAGSTVLLLGVLQSMLRLVPPGRWRLWLGLAFGALLLDDAIFQLSQQEYGVIAIDAYLRGQSSASRELLALAGRNPIAFIEGGIPHWVYPLWMITIGTLVLALARRALGWRWAATGITLLYLGTRVFAYSIFAFASFPLSFIPVMILPAAFLIDLAGQRRWSPLLTSLALTASYYAVALLAAQYTLVPRFAPETAPLAFVLLWAGFAAARWLDQRRARQVAVPAL